MSGTTLPEVSQSLPGAPIDDDQLNFTDEEAAHADDELTTEGGTDSPPPLTDGLTHEDSQESLLSHSPLDEDSSVHSHSVSSNVQPESTHSDGDTMVLNLDDEVAALVNEAQIDTMVPALEKFYSVNRLPLIQVLDRHIQVILNRSQAFENGQVTIYDKALLTLTQHGTNLDRPSAIQFFCVHFLSLPIEGDPGYGFEILNQAVRLQSVLRTELSSPAAPSSGDATAVDHNVSAAAAAEDPKPEREPRNLERLREVYQRAKNDFYTELNRPGRDDRDAHAAAMFLRDTAENLLTLLNGQSVDEAVLEDLNGTYTMAKAMVVSLVGGRKRKFDPVPDDAAIPTGPSGVRAGSSRSYNDNTRANENRGRSRTQTQGGAPPTFRREDRRDDERYSFEDQRSSFDERRAENERNDLNNPQSRANINNPSQWQDWDGRVDNLLPSQRGNWHRYDGLAMNERQRGGDDQRYAEEHGLGWNYETGTWIPGGRGVDSYRPDSRS